MTITMSITTYQMISMIGWPLFGIPFLLCRDNKKVRTAFRAWLLVWSGIWCYRVATEYEPWVLPVTLFACVVGGYVAFKLVCHFYIYRGQR